MKRLYPLLFLPVFTLVFMTPTSTHAQDQDGDDPLYAENRSQGPESSPPLEEQSWRPEKDQVMHYVRSLEAELDGATKQVRLKNRVARSLDFRVYGLNGTVIGSGTIPGQTGRTISLKGNPAGTYWLRWEDADKKVVGTFPLVLP